MREVMTNVRVYGFENSVKASKYPMSVDVDALNYDVTETVLRLGRAEPGSGHDQFLTGIVVQFDLTLSVKAWVEAERYHFLDFVSSQSTMHRILAFDPDTAYDTHVDPRAVDLMREKIAVYNRMKEDGADAEELAEQYLGILYTNPCGFRLTARMTTNYRQLKTVYRQRKAHRLPEWREFCRRLEELPHFRRLCLGEE